MCVQERTNGGPYQDRGNSQVGGPEECQTTMCNSRPYWILSKVHQGLCQITTPMEKLVKKDATFCWDEECQCSLDVFKENMVLVFLDWKK